MNKKGFIIILILCILCLTGCSKDDNETTLVTYTSVYPVEYIVEKLYGNNIAIKSIYPEDTSFNDPQFKLSNFQLDDISKGDLYIYSSIIEKEKNYAVSVLNKNKKIKIIDASLGMNYMNNIEEAWLNPSNFLMMASNIKEGLEEYINTSLEKKKINKNYEDLMLSLTEIDYNLKNLVNNSNNKTIVVSSDIFKFLEDYGFNVISLEENENLTDKVIADTKLLFKNKSVSYIFIKDNENENKIVKSIEKEYGAKIESLNTLSKITSNEKNENKDYMSIVEDNINKIKLELNN